MKFCDVIYLMLHIIYGTFVTSLLIAKECFFWIIPRKQKSVKDEIVVVTGAGHGLGRRVAINMGRLGAFVVCWDKNTDTNINTVYDIRHAGGRAVAYTCDVRDRLLVLETAEKVRREVGPVTMLINNAGIYPVKAILDWTPDELKDVFDTNIMAHFWTLKAFLPSMIEQNHGHIVAMASAAAILPVANEVPYSATKSAVSGLMDGLVQELRLNPKNKVKVTCVHPYYTAVRDDIPVKFDLRIDRMSPDYVAAEIVKGLRQNREAISVPRFMYFWICFARCLPQQARKRWREIFYTNVWPIPEEEVAATNRDAVLVINDKISYPETVSTPVTAPVSIEAQPSPAKPMTEQNSRPMLSNGVNLGFIPDSDLEQSIMGPKVNESSSTNGTMEIDDSVNSEAMTKPMPMVEGNNMANAAVTESCSEGTNNNETVITSLQYEAAPH